MPNQMKCETCIHFKPMKFHKAIDDDDSEQAGGTCVFLKDILLLTNSSLWHVGQSLYVPKSFGCVLHCDTRIIIEENDDE